MRVQPHLPSNPFTAIVTSISGLAFFACRAANSPAPPAPRIKMSVVSVCTLRAADAGEHGCASGFGLGIDARMQRSAVRIHRYQKRAEPFDGKLPQAFRMQIVK